MIRLPPFTFRRPTSLQEAASILTGDGPGTRLVAGGTDLWPNMKRRHQQATSVVSLLGIEGLSGISASSGAEARIGATTTLAEVAAHPRVRELYPGLVRAIESISSPPLRNMGTLGGNICVDTRCTYYNQTEEWRRSINYCMKAEGEICWVAPSSPRCWAHTASDSAPMLAALGAEVELVSVRGVRRVPIVSIYQDDGIEYLAKQSDEILSAVFLPAASQSPICRSSFWKLRRRGSIDFAVMSAAIALWLDAEGRIERSAIYLGAVASYPKPADKAVAKLIGEIPTEELLTETAELARRQATPMDNTDFQAQWRKAVAGKYIEAALREALGWEARRIAPKHSPSSHGSGVAG
ncbi:MAG: FAD binding domain-containing protein [Thermoanaerobaculia bacterium]|nr:FAD binding domain-containing protein [Thermoanaerobaculia bacterium]